MNEPVIIELASSKMKFSAAHFTIFSAEARENLHGHNFTVSVRLSALMRADGLAFDYAVFKNKVAAFCQDLDEKLLIPEKSPYLNITEAPPYIRITFAEETLLFLPRDVLLLPIANSSIESLAAYFLQKLCAEDALFSENNVVSVTVRVASSKAQQGEATRLL